jgi:hypothetical protein
MIIEIEIDEIVYNMYRVKPVVVSRPPNTRGSTTLHVIMSSLIAARLDATQNQAAASLSTAGPEGAGAIAMGSADTTFTDTRKVVLSLTSPPDILDATTHRKIRINLLPDPINFRLIRIYRVPEPTVEEGQVRRPPAAQRQRS